MSTSDRTSGAIRTLVLPADDPVVLARLEERLPTLLSIIAGMVDLTGFFTLGNIFTAHITGNLVVAAAAPVRGEPINLTQMLAIPVFILALAAVWLIARISHLRAVALARVLLLIQFGLLTAVLVFTVITKPSANPHGLMSGVAVMIAVSAMASQYALFRLAIPSAVSTAVMTGNLTNTVLSLMDLFSRHDPLMTADKDRLKKSVRLLFGFLFGCVIAAVAVALFADWAWLFPVVLSAVAIALR